MSTFEDKVKRLFAQHEELITRKMSLLKPPTVCTLVINIR